MSQNLLDRSARSTDSRHRTGTRIFPRNRVRLPLLLDFFRNPPPFATARKISALLRSAPSMRGRSKIISPGLVYSFHFVHRYTGCFRRHSHLKKFWLPYDSKGTSLLDVTRIFRQPRAVGFTPLRSRSCRKLFSSSKRRCKKIWNFRYRRVFLTYFYDVLFYFPFTILWIDSKRR